MAVSRAWSIVVVFEIVSKALYLMGLWETAVSEPVVVGGRGGRQSMGCGGGKRSLCALIILHGIVSSNLIPKVVYYQFKT